MLFASYTPLLILQGDAMKTNQEIAQEVLNGEWGNGVDRRERLTKAGYDYNKVQSIVNALVYGEPIPEDPEPEKPEEKKPLEIDYDFQKYDGIIINILI